MFWDGFDQKVNKKILNSNLVHLSVYCSETFTFSRGDFYINLKGNVGLEIFR